MRFLDTQIKIGINLYFSQEASTEVTVNVVGGTTATQKRKTTTLNIVGGKTLLFDSFVKKNALSVKPEYQNVVTNPLTPRKDQIAVEKFYEIQFEVLSQNKQEAIENYKKLLLIIKHLYYIKARNNQVLPMRYGNVGVVFRGNPPIFSINTNGIVGAGRDIPQNFGKQYECIIVTENFSYDIDYDKGYILVKSSDLTDDTNTKLQIDEHETLVPLAYTLTFNGTIPYDKIDGNETSSTNVVLPEQTTNTEPKKEPAATITEPANPSRTETLELVARALSSSSVSFNPQSIEKNAESIIGLLATQPASLSIAQKINNQLQSITALVASRQTPVVVQSSEMVESIDPVSPTSTVEAPAALNATQSRTPTADPSQQRTARYSPELEQLLFRYSLDVTTVNKNGEKYLVWAIDKETENEIIKSSDVIDALTYPFN